jgi:hypothetical protein
MSKEPENQSSELPRPPGSKKVKASLALEGLFANRPKPPAALDQPSVAEGPNTADQNTETQEEKKARILEKSGVSQRPNLLAGANLSSATKPKPTLAEKIERRRLLQEAAEKEEAAKKAAEPIVQNVAKENITTIKSQAKAASSFIPIKKEEKKQIDPEKAAAAQAKWAAKMAQKSDISLTDQLKQRLNPQGNTEQPKVSKLDLSKAAGLLAVIGKPRTPPQEQTEQGSSEQKRPNSRRNSKEGPSM